MEDIKNLLKKTIITTIICFLLGLVFCAGIYTFYEHIAGGRCKPNGTCAISFAHSLPIISKTV